MNTNSAANVRIITLNVNEAQAEMSRLLRLLPYSVDELEERASNYELRPAEQAAYRRIRDLRYLLGEDD